MARVVVAGPSVSTMRTGKRRCSRFHPARVKSAFISMERKNFHGGLGIRTLTVGSLFAGLILSATVLCPEKAAGRDVMLDAIVCNRPVTPTYELNLISRSERGRVKESTPHIPFIVIGYNERLNLRRGLMMKEMSSTVTRSSNSVSDSQHNFIWCKYCPL